MLCLFGNDISRSGIVAPSCGFMSSNISEFKVLFTSKETPQAIIVVFFSLIDRHGVIDFPERFAFCIVIKSLLITHSHS